MLERALPVGPVAIMSRGFGNCRDHVDATRDVWRVQYFNTMNTLILNTIEVVDVPEVAIAAREDLADSRERLAELVEWMGESCRLRRPARRPTMSDASARSLPGRPLEDRADDAARVQGSAGPSTIRPRATRCGRCRPARRSRAAAHWTCPTCAATKEQFLVLAMTMPSLRCPIRPRAWRRRSARFTPSGCRGSRSSIRRSRSRRWASRRGSTTGSA